MDILKDDLLEFLDFTGVEESERKRVLSSLHCTASNLQLPWIITQNVPSLRSKTKPCKNDTKKKGAISSNYVSPTVTASRNSSAPPGAYVGQFQPVYTITPNITPQFSVSPVPYSVPYPTAVVPIPPIYTNFHHGPQGIITNSSTLINPVMYSPEPSYTYAQISPVPASYDNIPQFAHSPQFGTNSTSLRANGSSSAVTPESKPSSIDNTSPQLVHTQNGIVPATNATTIANSAVSPSAQVTITENVNSDSLNSNVEKIMPLEKPVHPSPTVSYGVPNSSPFPANREINPPVCPSPAVTKTEYAKTNSFAPEDDQSGATTNGHNAIENSSSISKSWASLFNKGPSAGASNNTGKMNITTMQEIKDKENNNLSCPIKNPRKAHFMDPTCYRMAEFLISHVVDGKTISLQPRGLINRSNYCYINSILQALLACPPLYNLLSGLSKNITSNEKRKPTPVIDSMCKLVNEFEHLPAGQRVGRRTDKNQKKEAGISINCGNPFEPSWIYKMLNGMRSDSFLVEGRQEDAEEFFGCLLNGLNDEIQELMKLLSSDSEEGATEIVPEIDQESEDWQVMGPKNKGSVTRKTVFGKTPISNIFGGLLRSKIHRAGDESTNNIQPFFTLQLNIEKAKTVSEALEALATKNQLEGVTSSKTNEQVEAWQQVMIEELPVVLVLHLKCFDYQLNGCTKIMKTLEFPIDLKIDAKLLSSKLNSSREKQYKLFAVVYHDGKEASKGHYLTDAFHVGYNSWLRYDDASVKAVSEEQVLSPQGCRVPYLLFYRRSDTIRSK